MIDNIIVVRSFDRWGVCMHTSTISSKFQVVIPRKVRESMGLKPGQQLVVIEYGDRIEMVVFREPAEMRGYLPGIDPMVEREGERL